VLAIPDGLLLRATAVADAISLRTGAVVDAAQLITGRAALLGIAPRGRVSAGGATRLLETADGWCALTLSRPDDIAAVPALVEAEDDDPWHAVETWAVDRTAAQVIERAGLLGLPVAALGEADAAPPRVIGCGTAGPARTVAGLLVVDLTSMWAGPLCGQLLARGGATVVKVESPDRPDGTRAGSRAFLDWMNTGKLSYAVDFDREEALLRALLSVADVVLEGSRPSALARRGLGPHDIAPQPGRVWLRVTGHGTDDGNADRVAFGDDAAVAGGLVRWQDGEPAFLGDAIADPLAGLAAADAVLDALERGGGVLIEVSMAAVAAGFAPVGPETAIAVAPPAAVPAAAELGADNAAVQRLVAERSLAAC
jgi:hypothetical protein